MTSEQEKRLVDLIKQFLAGTAHSAQYFAERFEQYGLPFSASAFFAFMERNFWDNTRAAYFLSLFLPSSVDKYALALKACESLGSNTLRWLRREARVFGGHL